MTAGDQSSRLNELPVRERRGSRARCLLLTDGPDASVAERLTNLAAPFAVVDPDRHIWLPRGIANPREAKLGEEARLLSAERRETLSAWWLAARAGANTPNWDIASTCTIAGGEGLLLVEAKAHANELHAGGKQTGRAENDARIAAAISEASNSLNKITSGGWSLSAMTCYQLCNRFAWAWKLTSIGVPVVLVYLGFLNAGEMADQGRPLADAEDWQSSVLGHGRNLVPVSAWSRTMDVAGVPLIATIRSLELSLG